MRGGDDAWNGGRFPGLRDVMLRTNCSVHDRDECEKCELISGFFALFVQGLLAAICVLVLLIKRCRETPRRPWIVWFFDLSKQGFSSVLQHFANILFGVVLAEGGTASQCSWYFVLYIITSVAAVIVVAAGMRLQGYLVARYNLTLLRTGDYGSPPNWRPWLAQLLAWGFIGTLAGLEPATAAVVVAAAARL
jgi:hypothetical protein